MKEKKIYLAITSFLILLFDIGLVFILNVYSVKNTEAIYIISKCITLLAFACVTILGFFKKDLASYFLQYIITIVFQFVPLAIRYLSAIKKGFIVSVIILFISVLFYMCVEYGLLLLNKKTRKALENLKGYEIDIEETGINE